MATESKLAEVVHFAGGGRRLVRWGLLKAKLFRLSQCDYVLVLAFDHIISDGVSKAIVAREIWSLYAGALRARDCGVAGFRCNLPDYADGKDRMYDAWLMRHAA